MKSNQIQNTILKAIIIEDEIAATNLLSKIIRDYCPQINLVGDASNIATGIELIEKSHPELVFLDLRLQDKLSFEILDQIQDRAFYLIITTAYDEYAVKAFKYDAIDYILKPYVPKDIIAAINRVVEKKQSLSVFKKLHALLDQSKKEERISLATNEGIRLCKADEILRMEADGSYCKVYLKDETLILSKPLAEIERNLPKEIFLRVHKGHTINKNYVKSFKNADGGYIEMSDGTQVPIARRRKQDFINQIT